MVSIQVREWKFEREQFCELARCDGCEKALEAKKFCGLPDYAGADVDGLHSPALPQQITNQN